MVLKQTFHISIRLGFIEQTLKFKHSTLQDFNMSNYQIDLLTFHNFICYAKSEVSPDLFSSSYQIPQNVEWRWKVCFGAYLLKSIQGEEVHWNTCEQSEVWNLFSVKFIYFTEYPWSLKSTFGQFKTFESLVIKTKDFTFLSSNIYSCVSSTRWVSTLLHYFNR